MKETFEQNHNKTLTEEAEAQAMYEDLVAEKKKGIEVARERKNTKVMEVASALNEESRQGEGKVRPMGQALDGSFSAVSTSIFKSHVTRFSRTTRCIDCYTAPN